MLGAALLAFAALNAVGGLAALLGADILIVMLRIPVVADPFCIHAGKKIGYCYMLRAAVGAVAAGGAGYEVLREEELPYPVESLPLPAVEGLKFLHM